MLLLVPALLLSCYRSDQGPDPIPATTVFPETQPDSIVFQGDYPGWPWVADTRSGSLVCVWREGTVHDYSPSGRILLSRSHDAGLTWAQPTVIVDAPYIDDRNAGVVELPNGDLLLTYNTYTHDLQSVAMATRSTDGGRTWSPSMPIGPVNTRTKSAAIVLADGSLVLPYYVAPGSGSLAAKSTDNGLTWTTVAIPNPSEFLGDEWTALEVVPGRMVGILRNSGTALPGTFWKTESRDGGATWDVPVPTNVTSTRFTSPAHLVRLSGSPALVYSDARMVSVSAVRPQDGQFQTWDLARGLICSYYNSDRSPILDGSYPVLATSRYNTQVIVDYEIRADRRQISAYRFQFPPAW